MRFGYKHHTEASFLLLRVRDRDAARRWLAAVPVSTAATIEPPPDTALQVAFSGEGLRALGVADDIVDSFAAEFVAGMGSGDANRARRLGDVGANDPSRWQWGGAERVPHVLVLLYALPGRLAGFQRSIEAQCAAASSGSPASPPATSTASSRSASRTASRSRCSTGSAGGRRATPSAGDYSNLSCLGEYLLGYPNEYGGYTDRPLLDPALAGAPAAARRGRTRPRRPRPQRQLPRHAPAAPGRARLLAVRRPPGRRRRGACASGSPARWSDAGATACRSSARPTKRSKAAARPATSTPSPIAPIRDGLRCPLGAHVRRSNPRNADLPPGAPGIVSWAMRTLGFDAEALDQDLVASTRFHRLLRRGREYGAAVPMAQALGAAQVGGETGLHFICLGANIARQFEFVQNAWAMGTKFDGLPNESDPLLGTRLPAPTARRPTASRCRAPTAPTSASPALPQFVTVLGGAYFFLPGIRALRYLATTRMNEGPP